MKETKSRYYNYVGTLYALSVGVPPDRILVAEQEAACDDDVEADIGIREALKDYEKTDKQFNCSIRAEIIDDYDDTPEY